MTKGQTIFIGYVVSFLLCAWLGKFIIFTIFGKEVSIFLMTIIVFWALWIIRLAINDEGRRL